MKSRILCSLLLVVCLSCLDVMVSGCGGTSSGYVPVDSPLVKFEPPDKEDLVVEDDDDAATDAGDDWGDALDVEEQKDDGAAPAGGAPGN